MLNHRHCRLAFKIGALLLSLAMVQAPDAALAHEGAAKEQLLAVERWLLILNNELEPEIVGRVAASRYDMVVVDDVASLSWNAGYNMPATIQALKARPEGGKRLVLSYLNVGQAEDYRGYFENSWKKTPPAWLIGADPEGWQGNYPVAYWQPQWQKILSGPQGLVRDMAAAGFDGAYLDWVAGYWDPSVQKRAIADGVDAKSEMVHLLRAVASAAREINPDFLLIVQNAPDLGGNSELVRLADGFVQESIWFSGAAGDDPPGDCPMPRSEADIRSASYLASLPSACRRAHDQGRASALDYPQENVIVPLLTQIRRSGLAVFTVDYAQKRDNIAAAVQRSQALGFKPFVGLRALKDYVEAPF